MADTSIPQSRNEIITFYAQHAPLWNSDPTAIGLTMPTAAAVQAAANAAVAALEAAELARNASKIATDTLNVRAAELRLLGGAAVATIRAFAETTGDQTVYEKAQLSPPAPPKPAGPPSPATDFSADPRADGMIELKWKGTVAQNASFDLERSIDGGPYVLLDNVRTKKFLDSAVPMNTNMIVYRIYGKRDGVRSAPESTTVLFGNLPAAIQAAFRSPGPSAQAA